MSRPKASAWNSTIKEQHKKSPIAGRGFFTFTSQGDECISLALFSWGNHGMKDQQKKFFKLTNDIWVAAIQELRASDIKILFYLLTLQPMGEQYFQVRIADIAIATQLHRVTVSKGLRRLTDKGCIDLEIHTAWVKIKEKGRSLGGELPKTTDSEKPSLEPVSADEQKSEIVQSEPPDYTCSPQATHVVPRLHSEPPGYTCSPQATSCSPQATSGPENRLPEPVSEPLRLIDLNRSNRSLRERERDEKPAEFSTEFRDWLIRRAESLPRKPALLEQWIEKQAKKQSVVNEFETWVAGQKSSAAAPPVDERQFESQADYWKFINERSN